MICQLFGSTLPLAAPSSRGLYADRGAYLAAYAAATDAAIDAGFVLPEDRDAVLAEARPDRSSTARPTGGPLIQVGHVPRGLVGAMIPRVALVPQRFRLFFTLPLLRRAGFHLRRMTSGMDRAFFLRIGWRWSGS